MVHGTSYNVITTVNKNEYIRVFAGVGEWYIVQTDSDYVGAVSRKYVRAIYPSSSGSSNSGTGGSSSSGNTSSSTETSNMNSDEKEVFDLINKQRTNNGLAALKNDSDGNMGDRAGNFAVQNSDLLFSVGSRLSIRQIILSYDLT